MNTCDPTPNTATLDPNTTPATWPAAQVPLLRIDPIGLQGIPQDGHDGTPPCATLQGLPPTLDAQASTTHAIIHMTESVTRQAGRYQSAVETFVQAVGVLRGETRDYFYRLALHGLLCPWCQSPNLFMLREGRFRCQDCGQASDPTIKFQRCPTCDGRPALAFRRYHCQQCGEEITSRFLYDGIVYDPDYFRQKMAESRERRRHERQIISDQQATRCWQRSGHFGGELAIDLERSPGLADALNALVGGASVEQMAWVREAFDLAAYERHVLAVLDPDDEYDMLHLPAYAQPDDRLERIRLFIACLFLEQAGFLILEQRFKTLWVRRREAHR